MVKQTGSIKVIYKKGEVTTLKITAKLLLNKLELSRRPVYILKKEKKQKNIYYNLLLCLVHLLIGNLILYPHVPVKSLN
jgi:hypothetical protein